MTPEIAIAFSLFLFAAAGLMVFAMARSPRRRERPTAGE